MANWNSVTLAGHLGRDPELRTTKNGMSVCEVSMAVNNRRKEGDEWKTDTIWLDVTFWQKTAEIVCEYCRKGSAILVGGRLTEDHWADKDGNKRSKLKVTAHEMQLLGEPKAGGKKGAPTSQPEPSQPASPSDVEDSQIPF